MEENRKLKSDHNYMGGRDHRSMQKGQIKPVYHKKKIKEDPCRTPNKKIHTT